jgi:hypothetical protein
VVRCAPFRHRFRWSQRAPLSFSPASQVLPGCANVLVAPKNSTGICAARERPRGGRWQDVNLDEAKLEVVHTL